MTPLAYLSDSHSRAILLMDVRRALDEIAARNAVKVPAIPLEELGQVLMAVDIEEMAKGFVATLDMHGISRDDAPLIISAFRRALVHPTRAPDAVTVDFVEDLFERATLALMRVITLEMQRFKDHHDWVFGQLPAMMHSIDAEGRLVAVNERWLEGMGYTREEVLGRRSSEFLTAESARYARDVVLPAYFKTGRCDNVLYQFVRKDGSIMDIMLSAIADKNVYGERHSQAVLIDVTERLAAERAAQKVAVQDEMIRSQKEMLRAISTPLVPLGDGILLMPLVGDIDGARAEQIMAVLLEGIVSHAAEAAILDVTGVPSMDAGVAEGLLGATKAVGLLGAHVILTGIGPSAARILVELGVDLSNMTTKSTLRDGLAAARKRMQRKH